MAEEGVPEYRANLAKLEKVKIRLKPLCFFVKRGFFLFSLVFSAVAFYVASCSKDMFLQNTLISIAGGFFVYFCTVSQVSMVNRWKLRKMLKKKHEMFKHNTILLFLRCLKQSIERKDVERLLIPKEFWMYFWVKTNQKTRIDEVINVFNTDYEKLSDLKNLLNSFFDDISKSLVGGVVPLDVGGKMLAWGKTCHYLQQDSMVKADARYLVEWLFMWFADWSNLDESPYSFEHLINEI